MLKSPDTIGELLISGATIWPPTRAPTAPMMLEMTVPRCSLIPTSLKPAQPMAPPATIHRTMSIAYLQEKDRARRGKLLRSPGEVWTTIREALGGVKAAGERRVARCWTAPPVA